METHLATPPSEPEIAAALLAISDRETSHEVFRRLIFQRDSLYQRNRRLRIAIVQAYEALESYDDTTEAARILREAN